MKRIYTLLIIWMVALVPMLAQSIGGSKIQVDKQSVTISDNQMILVGMDITVPADMEISSDRVLTLTPVLQTKDGSQNKVLPQVVVYGRRREIIHEREGNIPTDAFQVLRRQKGVPQTVDFTVRNPAFKYAYDMISSKQIPFRNGKIRLELGPCDGKIILFTGKPIGKLSASAAGTAVPGKNITVKIRLENSTGLIPVLLDVYDAAGKKLSISRSSLLKNGVLDHIITIPVNAPAGRWKLVAKELARGQVRTVSFDVK